MVGAAIDLGNCLNLMERESAEILRDAYFSLLSTIQGAGGEANVIPTNQKGSSVPISGVNRASDGMVRNSRQIPSIPKG